MHQRHARFTHLADSKKGGVGGRIYIRQETDIYDIRAQRCCIKRLLQITGTSRIQTVKDIKTIKMFLYHSWIFSSNASEARRVWHAFPFLTKPSRGLHYMRNCPCWKVSSCFLANRRTSLKHPWFCPPETMNRIIASHLQTTSKLIVTNL